MTVLAVGGVSIAAAGSATHSGTDWPAPGGDWGSTRYSRLAQITTRTVLQLGGAWMVELPDGQVSKAPLMMSDGRLFVTSNQGSVFALDPATGRTLWRYKPEVSFSGSRGIGLGEGLLFAGLRDSNVVALEQATGRVAWVYKHGPEIPSQGMSSAPAYGNGVVVAVVSLGDNFLRGRAIGLDAKTGRFLWSFDSVPGPGQPGHETWPADSDIWKFGGGAIWTTPSVDEQLGLVYLETGNAVPQWGGELRAGDNLFNNSVVALELKTGRIRWYFQAIHHDIWEHDLSTPLVLYDMTVDGRQRKVLAAMRTDGVSFFLDRETGKPILPVDERPVKQNASLKTAATQPFTRGGERIVPECVEASMIPPGFRPGCFFDPISADLPNVMMPHMNMRQSPMAYSPQTGYLYATACVNPAWVRRDETGWAFIRPIRPPGTQQYGLIAALDTRNAKVVWQKRLAYSACEGGSGATATAGGLVFHAEPDGMFQAYDAKTGETLWRSQTGDTGVQGAAGPGAGSAISYEASGIQYVALAMNHVVWAYKLGGTIPPRPAVTPPPTTAEWSGPIQAAADVTLGSTTTFNIASAGRSVKWQDEFAVSPTRTRVKAGTTVTWTNTSTHAHTIVARDGSWATATIAPGQTGSATLRTPGTYDYTCKEHPWSMGQVVVDP